MYIYCLGDTVYIHQVSTYEIAYEQNYAYYSHIMCAKNECIILNVLFIYVYWQAIYE